MLDTTELALPRASATSDSTACSDVADLLHDVHLIAAFVAHAGVLMAAERGDAQLTHAYFSKTLAGLVTEERTTKLLLRGCQQWPSLHYLACAQQISQTQWQDSERSHQHRNHFEAVKWLSEHHLESESYDLRKWAATSGGFELLTWVGERYPTPDEGYAEPAMYYSASTVKNVQCLHNAQGIATYYAVRVAASGGLLRILEWVYANREVVSRGSGRPVQVHLR